MMEQRPKTYNAFNYHIFSKKVMSENEPGPKTYSKYGISQIKINKCFYTISVRLTLKSCISSN